VHETADSQETAIIPSRLAPAMDGVLRIVQLLPFQLSINTVETEFVVDVPTAVQKRALAHDTLSTKLD
jgi:hypothetical protein